MQNMSLRHFACNQIAIINMYLILNMGVYIYIFVK